ncbi:hypothetical protein Ahy_B04g071321 [Arachis hypogaea]|uniref:Uncharacterized protein n=1 Tax=Arachis hypogaea TaxID=3818 RepID=A0A444ZKH1_ARAHY|nr:hypothetical protein Ahy_B04g071321 [Arachis hypogaea]
MSTCSNPPPQATTILTMMTRTASYVPKEFPTPSFSLGFTDSSQEETLTQEGRPGSEKEKSPETPILIEKLQELVVALNFVEDRSPSLKKQPADQFFEKFETPARRRELSADLKEKCYLWATHIKAYEDGGTNKWEPMCILHAQQPMRMSKIYFTSLKARLNIEAEIVTAMCLILNKQNIRRFEEQIYCLPLNMAIRNHDSGEFLHAKTKKPFDIENYKMFIPFLDLKKLASHPYITILSLCAN